jgi:hypothetical protein
MKVRELITALTNIDAELDVVVDLAISVQAEHVVAQRIELEVTDVHVREHKARLEWRGR